MLCIFVSQEAGCQRWREAPAGFDPAAALQSVPCGIQGTLLNLENFARDLMDSFGNGPAVVGTECECPENQEVERALRKVDTLVSHLLPLSFYRAIALPL